MRKVLGAKCDCDQMPVEHASRSNWKLIVFCTCAICGTVRCGGKLIMVP